MTDMIEALKIEGVGKHTNTTPNMVGSALPSEAMVPQPLDLTQPEAEEPKSEKKKTYSDRLQNLPNEVLLRIIGYCILEQPILEQPILEHHYPLETSALKNDVDFLEDIDKKIRKHKSKESKIVRIPSDSTHRLACGYPDHALNRTTRLFKELYEDEIWRFIRPGRLPNSPSNASLS